MAGSPPERDVLLATKLQVPRSRPGLVPRRRLADQLEEGLNRGLVLVAAPAGYGKSVWKRPASQGSGRARQPDPRWSGWPRSPISAAISIGRWST
jgi:hypothetical protein